MSKIPKNNDRLRVVELFAGVGGFRIGLERASKRYDTVWASQWEPASGKVQHAAWTYIQAIFKSNGASKNTIAKGFSNVDINKVVADPKEIEQIPDHEILTGGFPCQDYSVARPASQAKGLEGKKGVLWWSIYKILKHKIDKKKPVKYLFLENVDRLLKSPTAKRGRDFAIMLSTLAELGYVVEWRVINAGEYGFPQRRRRIYIIGYHKSTQLAKNAIASKDHIDWVTKRGIVAKAFPVLPTIEKSGFFGLHSLPEEITRNFQLQDPEGQIDHDAPFQNAGLMIEHRVHTVKTRPVTPKSMTTLGDVLQDEKDVPEQYYIPDKDVKRWEAQKEAHKFERTSKSGHKYMYAEGALPFPDTITKSSRTVITSEGGKTPTRFKHVVGVFQRKGYARGRIINGKTYRYRRLTPIELERLCMFDDDHTKFMCDPSKDLVSEVPDTKRAFFMGNALVVGVITGIGRELAKRAE